MRIRHNAPQQLPSVRQLNHQVRRLESALNRIQGDAFQPAQKAPVNLTGTSATQAPATQAPASEADGYKKLIAADIKTAYGRDATQSDFDYWLPKMMGPNDSGFVTGGQMNATEYWHRRLLGWQAGGPDQATQGPYAHSSDAQGPVPAATDVVPGVAPGHVAASSGASSTGAADFGDFGSSQTMDAYRKLINSDMKTAYGRDATQDDYKYWLPKLMGPNDSGLVTSGQMSGTEYWHRRMLGWQAGGTDQATSGPYAHSADARGPVPSASDVLKSLS
jgi:hypothetical protein